MPGLPLIDLITILVYFLFVLGIGYWASRRIKNQEDYFLGGRRFGKFVQTFAAFGQGTSVESAVGISVIVYRNGVAGIWQSLTSVFSLPVYWITSIWYRRMRLLTLGDYFEERFGSKRLAALYALLSAVFFMIVIGLGFKAMTRTITGMTPKPPGELTVEERIEYEKAQEWSQLEDMDTALMSAEQRQKLDQLRLEKPSKQFSYIDENMLMWTVALIVILYAVFGGLEAAFLTDTLQGVFIVILSLLLLPFAATKINTIYGGSGLSGIIETARSRLPEAAFDIWGSPAMVDFTWYYIIAILIVSQINVAIQANQLVACGSAKDEYTARFGFTTGIYIKRAATLVWGISALLLVILYADVVKNPDYLWGYACRDLLGSLGIGLLGLMISCLLAALMSTADALMLTASSLLTHNFFRPFFPDKAESFYVWAGRGFGFLVILGGVLIANGFDNVFQMIKIIWEFNIVLAASFWLGLKWRRATRIGAWWSVLSALILFDILQIVIPMVPGVKTAPYLLKTNESIMVERTYTARDIDVIEREEEIARWDRLDLAGLATTPRPESLRAGESFTTHYDTPRHSIFWTQDLNVRSDGTVVGTGMLSLELVAIDFLGWDLSHNPYALNETIRLIIRLMTPFLVLFFVSLVTRPDDQDRLDRFFVRMKTPAQADRKADQQEVDRSYENPRRFDHKKMFPNSQWEFEKFERIDVIGILWFTLGAILILLILYALIALGGA